MNVLREQAGDLTEHSLDALAQQLLVVAAPQVVTSLRVTLARLHELDAVSLPCRVLRPVVGVTTIHEELTAFRQRERQHADPAHVRGRARQKGHLDGDALLGSDDLDPHAVEVAPLADDVAAELLVRDQRR